MRKTGVVGLAVVLLISTGHAQEAAATKRAEASKSAATSRVQAREGTTKKRAEASRSAATSRSYAKEAPSKERQEALKSAVARKRAKAAQKKRNYAAAQQRPDLESMQEQPLPQASGPVFVPDGGGVSNPFFFQMTPGGEVLTTGPNPATVPQQLQGRNSPVGAGNGAAARVPQGTAAGAATAQGNHSTATHLPVPGGGAIHHGNPVTSTHPSGTPAGGATAKDNHKSHP
jgi:hypothetical protein